MLTWGMLKKAAKDLPDDAPVLVRPASQAEYAVEPWRYNTREVQNAYQANDDRYKQNSVLCVELGDKGP